MVKAFVAAISLTVCSKFLGLQTFGSFKGFKLMGHVLKLGKIQVILSNFQ